MKSQHILTSACLSLTLIAAGTVLACAAEPDDQATTTKQSITYTMEFTGTPIKLSLNEAIKIMQTTGTGAQAAELNKKSAQAVAAGYDEDYSTARQALRAAYNSPSSVSGGSLIMIDTGNLNTAKNVSELSRVYAKAQGPVNYQTEMNKLEYDTVKTYFGLLQAQDNLKIAKDNLKVQEDILNITKKKLSLGLVAKKDVLSAETSFTKANTDLAAAEIAAKNAKMGFNYMMSSPLMQEIELTDSLADISAPAITLSDAINSALENRGEMRAAKFVMDLNQALLDGLKYRYPPNSSTYLKQQVALMQAEKNYNDSFVQIEMDVRAKYMALSSKQDAITSAKATLDNVTEMYRLAKISYDSGMNTLNDVQQAQIGVYQANLGLSATITEYDLAVYEFKYAAGAGTTPMPI